MRRTVITTKKENNDMPTGHYLTQEQIDFIREHFADTPNKELAKALGVSVSSVSNVQMKYRLKKSPLHDKEMHRLSGLVSAASWGRIELTPEVLAKRAASFKKTWQTEKARVAFGLPQKTKIRIRKCIRRKTEQAYYLRQRGYILDEDRKIAFFTPQTRRATRLEAVPRGKQIGSIKPYYDFKPLDSNS